MTGEEYEELVDDAYAYLQAAIDLAQDKFELGTYERYDYDQPSATLTFSTEGIPRVVVDVDAVGTWSPTSKSWLWAWGNSSLLPEFSTQSQRVREFGNAHHLEQLTEPYWPAAEEDAWAMTAVMAMLLEAKGAYRCPDGGAFLFLVFRELRRAT